MKETIFRLYKRGAALLIGFDDGTIVPNQTDITVKQNVDDMKFNLALVEWSSFVIVFGSDLTDPIHSFYAEIIKGKQFDGLVAAGYDFEDIAQRLVKINFNFKAYAFISGETYNANIPLKEI